MAAHDVEETKGSHSGKLSREKCLPEMRRTWPR